VKHGRLATTRGIAAALLALVASFATSTASVGASRSGHDDLAFQSAPTLHAPVAQRAVDEQRGQRRVSPVADLPFVADARHELTARRASAKPAVVEQPIVARGVPRAYDATAPPALQS